MKTDSITLCKSGITVITEDADGDLYTIVASHVSDLIADWHGSCNFVPSNDAPVYFAVYNGTEIHSDQDCSFENLMKVLETVD